MALLGRTEVVSLLDRGYDVGPGGLADQRSHSLCGPVYRVHWDDLEFPVVALGWMDLHNIAN